MNVTVVTSLLMAFYFLVGGKQFLLTLSCHKPAQMIIKPLRFLISLFVIETERRIRANDRTYNAQFRYAVSFLHLLLFSFCYNFFGLFQNNYIKTSKYSLLTFLPLNLFEQFQRLANFYFLCLLVLQVSISSERAFCLFSFLLLVFDVKGIYKFPLYGYNLIKHTFLRIIIKTRSN